MFRLSRLVWRDAVQRYWVGLSLVCAPGAYLGREWPPWVLRDALWRGGPLPTLGIAIVYVLLTLGPTRQLVASERLTYWRQCPISPGRWRVFHGIHLALMHGPAFFALSYGLAPAGLPAAIGGPVLIAAVTIVPLAWRLGHPVAERPRWALRLPRPRSAAMALARVLLLAVSRTRTAALAGVVTASVGLAVLGRVATLHVAAAGEPPAPAAWGFAAASSVMPGAAVWLAWPRVRRVQWWFDSQNVRDWIPVVASIAVVALVSLPASVVLVSFSLVLPFAHALLMMAVVVFTWIWAGAATFALDADAVRRRYPAVRRTGRFVLVFALPIPLAAWQPLTLLVPAALALLRARRLGIEAYAARRRFELDDAGDDHG